MKKLIEELQTEIERRDLKEAALEGLFLALQIVKSHDPWIDVSEEPPKYDTYLVVTEGNCIDMAHFAMVWSDGRMTSGRPIKWTYLPEAKP